MSNTDLKPTDHSNTIVEQSPENASVVSIFPLVGNEPLINEETQPVSSGIPTTPNTPSPSGNNY